MIRNVVLGRLREQSDPVLAAADSAQLDDALSALVALPYSGLIAVRVGRDLSLRAGGWSFAITSDWADAASYRVYDLDEEHNRVRREMFAPICEQIARVQFAIPS